MEKKIGSLTAVFNGDWNNLYIQPDWLAKNVYEQPEIEVGVNGIGAMVNVLYKYGNVVINPSQNQVIFSAEADDKETIDLFCKAANNFLTKAHTPRLISFGLNADFEDTGDKFAETIDKMWDNDALIECGCEIIATKISRSISLDGNIYNIDCVFNGNTLMMHINEHHSGANDKADFPSLKDEYVNRFWDECWKIIGAMGYERENAI